MESIQGSQTLPLSCSSLHYNELLPLMWNICYNGWANIIDDMSLLTKVHSWRWGPLCVTRSMDFDKCILCCSVTPCWFLALIISSAPPVHPSLPLSTSNQPLNMFSLCFAFHFLFTYNQIWWILFPWVMTLLPLSPTHPLIFCYCLSSWSQSLVWEEIRGSSRCLHLLV